MADKEIKFMKAEPGEPNLADDPKIALIAACIVMQQGAGFRDKKGNPIVDLRQSHCPGCNAPGFNTGWGVWRFLCGAEVLTGEDGGYSKPCGASKAPAVA